MRAIVYPGNVTGEQLAPASKSSMQRACAAALLHIGKTTILNPGHSNDDLAAIDVIQKLGATVEQTPSALNIISKGVNPIGTEMN
ncbi:MAG: 3-phosphoshikimate 1-carboxyvinyltransferase, partial [Bacteroidota bacterium]